MSSLYRVLPALRGVLLALAAYAGLIVFWLPAHEVFEGPKTYAFLVAACLLLPVSLDLWPAFGATWRALPRILKLAPLLLLASHLVSLLGALGLAPLNLMMPIEKLAPSFACAWIVWLLWVEGLKAWQRFVTHILTAHALLVFYGLIQLLDQTLGRSMNWPIDMIRWTSFGESRVYSSLGNPDYMAAQLTLFLPLWLAWGRDTANQARLALKAAALALLVLPPIMLFLFYAGTPGLMAAASKAYMGWALLVVSFWVAAKKMSSRGLWLGFGLLAVLLIIVAQGRGAYLGLLVSGLCILGLVWQREGRSFFVERMRFFKGLALVGVIVFAMWAGAVGLRKVSPQAGFLRWAPLASSLRVSDALLSRLVHLGDAHSDSMVVRQFYYKAAWRMGLKHPFFGVGYGNHALATARAQSEIWKEMRASNDTRIKLVEPHVELYAHNDFLQTFAECGLPGLAALLYFLFIIGQQAWRLSRQGWNQMQGRWGYAVLGMLAAFVTSSLVNFPWRVLASQQTLWWALASIYFAQAPKTDLQPAKASGIPPWAWAFAVLGLVLAVFPYRWFLASLEFKKGNAGRDSGRWAEALAHYEKAAAIGANGTQRVELYLYIGSAQNMVGRADLAEAWFKKAIEAYPDFLEANYNLGFTYQNRYSQTRQPKDLVLAAQSFEKTLEINPRYVGALNNLGNIAFASGRYGEAEGRYREATDYAPQTFEAWYNLGATLLLQQKRDQGEAALLRCLQVNPQYAQALQLLNQVRAQPRGRPLKFQ